MIIKQLGAQTLVTEYLPRLWQMELYFSIQNCKVENAIRTSSAVYKRVGEELGLEAGRLSFHRGVGERLASICGGHIGLAVFIPLEGSHSGWNITSGIERMCREEATNFSVFPSGTLKKHELLSDAFCAALCPFGFWIQHHSHSPRKLHLRRTETSS